MKTLSDYTIYCTGDQTKKALKLGAPIETQEFVGGELDSDWCYDIETNWSLHIPTAEQMRGWLEDIFHIQIDVTFRVIDYDWSVRDMYDTIVSQSMHVESRKEATLAAIDAALEYLTKNKK